MAETRALSYWGWGYEDRFPDRAGRQAMGEQIRSMLGFTGLTIREPRPLSAIALPPSRVEPPPSLREQVSTAPRDRAAHTYGRGFPDILRGFGGDFGPAPDLVARPRGEADLQAWMAWADSQPVGQRVGQRVGLIPFGGGTSVVGGVEPDRRRDVAGWVSLDMRHMQEVLEVDAISRLARIQAGATGPCLEQQLAAHGLTLRHYPQSFEFSTLGGWIATRAGGHYATLRTHIDERVAALRVVSPAGVYASRCLPGSGAGPSPDRLIVGSEGALGVITEAWVRVDARPRWFARASVRFADFGDGVAASRTIAQSGLYPANCRLLDPLETTLHGVTFEPVSVLLLGFESADHPVGEALARALELARAAGGEIDESAVRVGEKDLNQPRASAAWRQAFVDAPYLVNILVSLGVIADTFETACTWANFEELDATLMATLRETMHRVCGGGVIARRFTHIYPDGPAPYYTFVAPGRDGAELEQWSAIKAAASDVLIRLGATITHHHAVGRVHRPWYAQQAPTLFEAALKAAKGVFDPHAIMNPGVLLG